MNGSATGSAYWQCLVPLEKAKTSWEISSNNDFKLFQVAKLEVTDGLQVQVMQSLERAGDTERRKMTKTPKAQPLTCSSHDNLWSPKRSAESLTRTASI